MKSRPLVRLRFSSKEHRVKIEEVLSWLNMTLEDFTNKAVQDKLYQLTAAIRKEYASQESEGDSEGVQVHETDTAETQTDGPQPQSNT